MISHNKHFIFFHVARTGGTSIECALTLFCEHAPNRLDGTSRELESAFECLPAYQKHATAQTISDAMDASDFKKMFRFAFVRNPWDRIVSLYHWGVQMQPSWKQQNFRDWLKTYYLAGWSDLPIGWGLQCSFLQVGNVLGATYVGRFETIEQDFRTVCAVIGVEATLPRKWATEHRSYREYYDRTSQEAIGTVCEEDIDRFSYVF